MPKMGNPEKYLRLHTRNRYIQLDRCAASHFFGGGRSRKHDETSA